MSVSDSSDSAERSPLDLLALVTLRTRSAVIIMDAQARIEWVNDSFTTITGYPLEDVAQLFFCTALLGPQADPKVVKAVRKRLHAGNPFHADLRARHRDGHFFWLETEVQPVHNENGELVMYFAIHQDITARKQAQIQLQASKAELQNAKQAAEAASRAKSQFLANMSHEVRTPMAAIVGYAEMLLDPRLGKSDRNNVVHSIRRNGEHLMSLINDMLDLSKIEAGRMEMDFSSCRLWPLITEVMSVVNVRAQQKGILLAEVPIGPLPRAITTDPVRFRQILVNLLSNAVKFTDPGFKVELRVQLVADDVGNPLLMMEVDDEGCGMSEEVIARLFQPFEQGDATTSRRHEGTGLGLSITKHLVEAMNGDITLTSTVGIGTCFTVWIALHPNDVLELIDSNQLSTELAIQLPTIPHAQHLEGRILLAEDNPDNRNIVRYFLERVGLQVEVAEDGKQAMEMIPRNTYDMILMDMQMPIYDGYSTTSTLRANGCTLPIVAITAHAMIGDEERCLQAGCNAYLTKPIDAARLVALVSRYLPKKTLQKRSSSTMHFPAEPPSGAYELEKLQTVYRDSLPEKWRELHAARQAADWLTLARLVHMLRGSAGMYGFSAITETAGLLEDACNEEQGEELIAELMTELHELMDAVRK